MPKYTKKQPLLFTTTRSQVPYELQSLIRQLASSRIVSEGAIDASILDDAQQTVSRLLTHLPSHGQALSQMRKVLKRQEYAAECVKNVHHPSSIGSLREVELNLDHSFAVSSECDLDVEVDFDSLFASTGPLNLDN